MFYMERKRLELFLGFNILIVIFEVIGIFIEFFNLGMASLAYYTHLSNILLFISAIVNIMFSARELKNKKNVIPFNAWKLFYVAVSATTVTFLVVIFVLSWMYGDLMILLTYGSMLYTHTLCPLLALMAFVICAPKKFVGGDALRAVGFTLAYGVVIMALNIIKVVEGPYPFLFVYRQPVWMTVVWSFVIVAVAYVVARLLLIGKIKKMGHKHEKAKV